MGRKKSLLKKIGLSATVLLLAFSFAMQLFPAKVKAASASDAFSWYKYPGTVYDSTTKEQFTDNDRADSEGTNSFALPIVDTSACDMSLGPDPNVNNAGKYGGGSASIFNNSSLGPNPGFIVDFKSFPQNISSGGVTTVADASAQLYEVVRGAPRGISGYYCSVQKRGDITVKGAGKSVWFYQYDSSYKIGLGYGYSDEQVKTSSSQYTLIPKGDTFYDKPEIKKYLTDGMLAYVYTDTSTGGNGCQSWIAIDPNNPSAGKVYTYSGQGCTLTASSPVDITITSTENFDKDKAINATDADIPVTLPTDTATGESDWCLSFTNPMTWILCPVLQLADGIIDFGKQIIKGYLIINPSQYGENEQGVNRLKTAWSAVRIISSILLVAIALFMIISQILGFDFMSAYTVKKVVPRLVAAVILMQLSWLLITGTIGIVNIIGSGIRDLLYLPFGLNAGVNDDINALIGGANVSGGATAFATGTLLVAAGVTIASAGILMAVITVVVGAAISVIVTIATLILRQLVILALLVIAPLAVIAWILPGTEKYWKMWSSNLLKLLMMFPLIMGFMAIGVVFAKITSDIPPSNVPLGGTIRFLTILLAYFAPFFLIPKTFKMGGSLMGSISGAVTNMSNRGKKGIMESKPMQNVKTSRDQAKKIKGLERATSSSNGFIRNYGRLQAGTFGAYGRYGKQLRQTEKQATIKNSELELQSQMDEDKVYEWEDQKKYMKLAAMGGGEFVSEKTKNADGTYKKYTVKAGTGASMQSATTWLADKALADELRQAKAAQYAKGRQDVWTGAMATHAGKVVSIASDAAGKPFEALTSEQTVTQDATSMRNMTQQYMHWETELTDAPLRAAAAQAAGDQAAYNDHMSAYNKAVAGITSVDANVNEILTNKDLTKDLSGDRRQYIQFLKDYQTNPNATAPPDISLGVDFGGRKQGDSGYSGDKFMPKL